VAWDEEADRQSPAPIPRIAAGYRGGVLGGVTAGIAGRRVATAAARIILFLVFLLDFLPDFVLASYVLKAEQKEFNILKRPPAGK
jgi:hypothetical protein